MVSNTKDMKVHMKPLNCTSYGGRWDGVAMLVYQCTVCTYH